MFNMITIVLQVK